jgi:hypothetical protein
MALCRVCGQWATIEIGNVEVCSETCKQKYEAGEIPEIVQIETLDRTAKETLVAKCNGETRITGGWVKETLGPGGPEYRKFREDGPVPIPGAQRGTGGFMSLTPEEWKLVQDAPTDPHSGTGFLTPEGGLVFVWIEPRETRFDVEKVFRGTGCGAGVSGARESITGFR